ncbi:cytochrome P450 [Mycena albidolilacea]|uniref:Cytochrome P450 n=1 Tax=Mycena albidolilacea TaxID=1033008 RepID=A0AAD7A5S8_9AGAR|nr:cytochrome P450 [Mycena albidolilacea]
MYFKLALAGFAVPVILVYWFNKRSLKSLEIRVRRRIPSSAAHSRFRQPKCGNTMSICLMSTVTHRMPRDFSGAALAFTPHDGPGKYQSNHMRFKLLPYGESFRRQLGAFHQMLEPRAVGGYETLQLSMSLRLLRDMAKAQTEFFRHVPRFPASLVFALIFGRELEEHDLAEVQKILADFVFDINPGAHLVDTFPMLDLLPDFLSPWRAEARRKHLRELAVNMLYGGLWMDVKKRMEEDASPHACGNSKRNSRCPTRRSSIFSARTRFASGTGTSAETMLWFVMAFCTPEAAKKAQEEINNVFNVDTLFDLPYCFALLKEVVRWSPVVPLSFPHYLDADDEYKGYKIKKGSTFISSLWNMHHNEEEFPNPYKFEPKWFMIKKHSCVGVWLRSAESRWKALYEVMYSVVLRASGSDCAKGIGATRHLKRMTRHSVGTQTMKRETSLKPAILKGSRWAQHARIALVRCCTRQKLSSTTPRKIKIKSTRRHSWYNGVRCTERRPDSRRQIWESGEIDLEVCCRGSKRYSESSAALMNH